MIVPEVSIGPFLAAGLRFDAVLRPHRSLPPQGFLLLMAVLCASSAAAGVLFVLMGAWPVMGFLALDVLLVHLLFRLNYRAGRVCETVQLSDETLRICRFDAHGRRRSWDFQAYWARAGLEAGPGRAPALVVSSHGRRVAIGSFLGPDAKESFALALSDALARARETRLPAGDM